MSREETPVLWSVAGTDSGGGAGLAADHRAAAAFDTHLGAVVAAVTAQNSQAVHSIESVSPALFAAQWQALEQDMPPRVVKTGLLGSVEHVRAVAAGIDRLRRQGPVALVVDPVLRASSGASFADDELVAVYRHELLPRATVLTPNRHEALRLAGEGTHGDCPQHAVPELAARLRSLGAQAVCITGGDSDDGELALDWLSGGMTEGWLALRRVATPHTHGTGCTFATSLAAAMARGFVAEDAAVLAKMATTHALRRAQPAGRGPGPVRAGHGFANDPSLMPHLSFGAMPEFAPLAATTGPRLGLYAIVDSAERLEQVLAAGVRCVQLRIKVPPDADVEAAIRRSVRACAQAGAQLFVNDHWELALAAGAPGVHLGQEDLLALGEAGRTRLRHSGLALGVSSHSLWELCRARSLAPRYIACGPVWPTLTKAMPWHAQGLHNLRWWRQMAGTAVVAIGGVLTAEQVAQAASTGVDGVCVVRAVGDNPATQVPRLLQALNDAPVDDGAACELPHPSLDGLAGIAPMMATSAT
jgi:hydroxymethylpyrimidine kinase/phosphomethylpyrimidine kinase/thiamine-phosphate diphosphorylase